MKPSYEELHEMVQAYETNKGAISLSSVAYLAKAELQRRQQPLPAGEGAAYGREQAQSGVMVSHDAWAELVARHPETMQILFGGQP